MCSDRAEKNLETSKYVVKSYCKSEWFKSFAICMKTVYWFLSYIIIGVNSSCICGKVLRLMLLNPETESCIVALVDTSLFLHEENGFNPVCGEVFLTS